jgi:hypothetical protein
MKPKISELSGKNRKASLECIRKVQSMNKQMVKGHGHPEREIMVAYVICHYSAGKRKACEDHCLDCHQCRTQLAVLQRLHSTPIDDDELRDLVSLLPYGRRAAAQARQIIMQQENDAAGFHYRGRFWSGTSGVSPNNKTRV